VKERKGTTFDFGWSLLETREAELTWGQEIGSDRIVLRSKPNYLRHYTNRTKGKWEVVFGVFPGFTYKTDGGSNGPILVPISRQHYLPDPGDFGVSFAATVVLEGGGDQEKQISLSS